MSETGEVHNVPGSVLDCYCTKCERMTEHTVVTASKLKVREVKCEACGFVHKYTKGKKQASSKSKSSKRGRKKKQKEDEDSLAGSQWEEEMGEKGSVEPVHYRLGGSYAEGTVISHPTFGVGIVKRILSETKIEALFKKGKKHLVQNIKK
jgi:hypothetical protein